MEKWQPSHLLTNEESMVKYTKKEIKFLDGLIRKTFDGNHVTCSHGCPCREEAIRRMARTLIMVDEIIVRETADKGRSGWGKTIRDRIKQSLEEE
jgi:hypothetical protein